MNPATVIHDYVIAKAANESLPTQVQLYRALGSLVGSENKSRILNQLADELDAALRTQQLLSFASDLDSGNSNRGTEDGGRPLA